MRRLSSKQVLSSPLTAHLDPMATDHIQTSAAPLISLTAVDVVLGGGTILQDINLHIGKGEFVSLVGPSGCGKTTLLRVVAGLLPPTSGSVMCGGAAVTGPRRDVAIVFQDYGKALLPWRTAAGNVSLAFEAAGIPARKAVNQVRQLLDKLSLARHADKYPNQLSGGMQQRLQIARCLAQSPSILLMDEPFGALDAMTRQALQDEILRIVSSTGATAVFVTHDLEEAIYLGDRVVCLSPNPGKIAKTVDTNLPRPRNQLSTREDPEFLRLRRLLFNFIKDE